MIRDFSKVMHELKKLTADLLQVAVYNTYMPHCIIIFQDEPDSLLDSLEDLRHYCQKRRLPFPLIVSKQFVLNSLDSFPLEFLDIVSSRYENLLVQEDVLASLTFSNADLRLQMEREVKSKLLLTRLTVLESNPKPKLMAATLTMSIRAILPVLKGLCYIADRPIPTEPMDLTAQASDVCGLELNPLGTWLNFVQADASIVKSYLELLFKLMQYLENND